MALHRTVRIHIQAVAIRIVQTPIQITLHLALVNRASVQVEVQEVVHLRLDGHEKGKSR